MVQAIVNKDGSEVLTTPAISVGVESVENRCGLKFSLCEQNTVKRVRSIVMHAATQGVVRAQINYIV